jgi:hypothetical protein
VLLDKKYKVLLRAAGVYAHAGVMRAEGLHMLIIEAGGLQMVALKVN